jgi:UDP-N-acetylglucosamine 4,6-dehydratase/5-epimerase
MFKNKCLMITGGTGSFGGQVLKRFLQTDIGEIRIFSRDEKKQEEMRVALNNSKIKFYIGDVRDFDSVHQAMKGVDYVFHAAALKQVPSCEFYPLQAVRTNILGAENVMEAAVANRVPRLVVLSTDKAVYPINAMGMSKALMEKLMVAKSRTAGEETVLCATRYGNVMGSRGSVIPHFVSQIKDNKPLTVTDPNMTRFLMSLDESVDLVLYAYQNAKPGDIYVQKAPAATLGVLAQALRELFNRPEHPIKIIGTRHGEKLYESLLSREERAKADEQTNYYRVPADNRDLNYSLYFSRGEERISSLDDYTSHNTDRLDVPRVKDLLHKLDFIQQELKNWA